MPLLEFNDKGIYCPKGKFYIDPWQKVEYAVITHAHSDHARWGNSHYLAHNQSEAIMRLRLGKDISFQGLAYNQPIWINGVKLSLHPAGHIVGSAQIRLESEGEIWVVSGDYKLENDGLSTPFEPVVCDCFITESTFGLPVYKWQSQSQVFETMNHWWQNNANQGFNSLVFAYVLGKSQRIMFNLDPCIGPMVVHSGVAAVNDCLSVRLPEAQLAVNWPKGQTGAFILAPPSAVDSPWLKRFEPYRSAVASGWMALRGMRRRRSVEAGFVLSDHADWQGLLQAIEATQASKVFVTHGYSSVLAKYLSEQKGIQAAVVSTQFETETEETVIHLDSQNV
jgi:putative mRNA 3-end processing factor